MTDQVVTSEGGYEAWGAKRRERAAVWPEEWVGAAELRRAGGRAYAAWDVGAGDSFSVTWKTINRGRWA